jgi:hypothetical protein
MVKSTATTLAKLYIPIVINRKIDLGHRLVMSPLVNVC